MLVSADLKRRDDGADPRAVAPRRGPEVGADVAFDDVLQSALLPRAVGVSRPVRRYAGRVLGYLRAQRAVEPEDLTSEVFLRVFDRLSQFSGDEIALPLVAVHDRAPHVDRRRPPATASPADDHVAPARDVFAAGDVEQEALANVGTDWADELVASLPADQRAVVALRVTADLSLEQVAEILGKRVGAVKSLQHRALAALRRRCRGGAGMNDTHVLERLVDRYASVPAPAPSAALLARMEPVAATSPTTTRPRVQWSCRSRRPSTACASRYLVAAMVATFVVFSGLAVAGALPDPIQRGVASVVSHVGIDLPAPEPPAPRPGPWQRRRRCVAAGHPGASMPDHDATGSSTPAKGGSSTAPSSSPTTVAGTPNVLGDPSVPTTVPSTTIPGGLLPPLDVPALTLPPLTVPQVTVPTLPLAPVTVPPLPPLPPLDLPGL